MVDHRIVSSAMNSNDDNDLPVHSLMYLPHDLRGMSLRRPTTYCSVRWRQTWPNHDELQRLTVDNKSSGRRARTLICYHTYLMYCVLCMICQSCSCCSTSFPRLASVSPDLRSASSSRIQARHGGFEIVEYSNVHIRSRIRIQIVYTI